MTLSELLTYFVLFAVPFLLGCAHGMRCDIAEKRQAMKEPAWHRAA
jgi:hypothetical protein